MLIPLSLIATTLLVIAYIVGSEMCLPSARYALRTGNLQLWKSTCYLVFTVEVLTLRGLVTYYVLFFIHLDSRKVEVSGLTPHPNERWMKQIAINVTMEYWGFLNNCRYLIHDRDTKYCQSFRDIIESGDVKTLPLPARSPNLNAFSERWVKSIKDDCLSKLILFGETSLRRALHDYLVHYHAERNHQGKGNVLLFPTTTQAKNRVDGSVRCKERLGGLLKYYHREAA